MLLKLRTTSVKENLVKIVTSGILNDLRKTQVIWGGVCENIARERNILQRIVYHILDVVSLVLWRLSPLKDADVCLWSRSFISLDSDCTLCLSSRSSFLS